MREFKLINKNNQEFNLMRQDAFFREPNGLGFFKNIEAVQVSQYFLETKDEPGEKTITGNMIFKTYEAYQEFINFVSSERIILAYKPISTWYYIECKCQSIEKSEKTALYRLNCPVVFICYSEWYEKIELKTSTSEADGKIYPVSYNYYYKSYDNTVTILNGKKISPCKISIFGPCVNPSWNLLNGNRIVSTGAITVDIPENHKLVIDSNPDNLEIAEYTINNEFIANRYNLSNFSTERFIYLEKGTNIINFDSLYNMPLNIIVEVKKIAESI